MRASSSRTEPEQHLTELLDALIREQESPWPGLKAYKVTEPTEASPVVYRPCLCVVAQGAKIATLGSRVYHYDPLRFLIIGAPLPVRARIVEASPEKPFISMVLDIDSMVVHELLLQLEEREPARAWDGHPPIRSSPLEDSLIDALMRFLRAVQRPMDRQILAPAIFREIIYHLLSSEQGDILRVVAARHSQARGIVQALDYIHHHFDQRLDIPTLAREAGMSVSGLHHNFKAATDFSPMQYLKRIRLERALHLMLDQELAAGEAAFKVGYASPSQFSREFKRLFGSPPREYLEIQRSQRNMEFIGASLMPETGQETAREPGA